MGVDLNIPPALPGVLETVLYARDLVPIEDFYRRVFGIRPFQAVAGRHLFYRLGSQMLLIFNPEASRIPPGHDALPVPPHGTHGEGHVCFRSTRDDLVRWRHRLQSLHIPIEADFEWPRGGHSIYFRDPAGNCIEFAEPRIWGLQ